jgi:hypothetical protein
VRPRGEVVSAGECRPYQVAEHLREQVLLREPPADGLTETLSLRESGEVPGARGHLPHRVAEFGRDC